ncbi:unnamed protein product [Medioppia subpectinata]|uniref:RING-type domain-containing protein n=1 Tax=Medioppia subpectinata TaxID=1979941 RepID=A0A7R9Q0W0_9ACAR|nr:unnamed protein product [Medioppia subpectinata]CAG2108559.1 unnamed protein product [Medioppia subpectinata]
MVGHDIHLFAKPLVIAVLAKVVVCGLCHGVCDHAVDTQCGHRYCRQCIADHITATGVGLKLCPECDQSLVTDKQLLATDQTGNNDINGYETIGGEVLVKSNDIVNGIINALRIRCERSGDGCPAVVPVAELAAHRRQCPYAVCEICDALGANTDGHDCVQELKRDRNEWREKCGSIENKYKWMKGLAIRLAEKCKTLAAQLADSQQIQAFNEIQLECQKRINLFHQSAGGGQAPHPSQSTADNYNGLVDDNSDDNEWTPGLTVPIACCVMYGKAVATSGSVEFGANCLTLLDIPNNNLRWIKYYIALPYVEIQRLYLSADPALPLVCIKPVDNLGVKIKEHFNIITSDSETTDQNILLVLKARIDDTFAKRLYKWCQRMKVSCVCKKIVSIESIGD